MSLKLLKKQIIQICNTVTTNDETQMTEIFAQRDMAKILADDQQILDTSLQLSEITEAIKLMHSGNSLGPGQFLVEFYVKF